MKMTKVAGGLATLKIHVHSTVCLSQQLKWRHTNKSPTSRTHTQDTPVPAGHRFVGLQSASLVLPSADV